MWLCCIRVASGEAIKHIFRTLHWACNAVVQTTIHFIEYTHETREPSDGNEKKNGRPAYEVLGELLFIIINYLFFECYYSFKEKHCGIFSADFDFQSNWLKYRFFFIYTFAQNEVHRITLSVCEKFPRRSKWLTLERKLMHCVWAVCWVKSFRHSGGLITN